MMKKEKTFWEVVADYWAPSSNNYGELGIDDDDIDKIREDFYAFGKKKNKKGGVSNHGHHEN